MTESVLKAMYEASESKISADVPEVLHFYDNHVEGNNDLSNEFWTAIGSAHYDGYKRGIRAAIELFTEVKH